ncbi:MAG TPA: PrgI family protein [Candidatus Paceibacterota bacterium]|nr:PrgI family protein [Candidatus Paceibacterota bacterium]
MRYQVPQFIETETKLVGPFTLRQFLWVAAGACFLILEFLFLSGPLRLGAAIITLAFFGSLAFVKIDGQPLINFFAYMLSYALGAKEYLFRRSEKKTEIHLPGMPGN